MQVPEKLLADLRSLKDFDERGFVRVHQEEEQITSVRFNPLKIKSVTPENYLADYTDRFPQLSIDRKIPWSSFGYYLGRRPSFTLDPLFHAGVYYAQEASSMFLEQVIRQHVDLKMTLRVIDLCAAPGGKSTLMQSLISGESLLVSNEVIKTRVNVLSENITKWGASNVMVTNNDPKDFSRLENFFDVMMVDAPCSGSGLFRKEPAAANEWSEENVKLCSQRQQRIIGDAIPALKQDGILIYSTCSYSEAENEDILDWLTEKFSLSSLPVQIEENWNIIETFSKRHQCFGYRFYPDKIKGEGFFIAVFRKTQGDQFHFPKNKRGAFEKLTKKEEDISEKWIYKDGNMTLLKNDSFVYAIPDRLLQDFNFLKSNLYIKKAGVFLGKITPHELIPDHELALSIITNEKISAVEVTREIALSYLRKDEIRLDSPLKGWALVKFESFALGWIKILPNRINNYYPSEWRIRI